MTERTYEGRAASVLPVTQYRKLRQRMLAEPAPDCAACGSGSAAGERDVPLIKTASVPSLIALTREQHKRHHGAEPCPTCQVPMTTENGLWYCDGCDAYHGEAGTDD